MLSVLKARTKENMLLKIRMFYLARLKQKRRTRPRVGLKIAALGIWVR